MRRALIMLCALAGCGDPCDGIAGACLALYVDPATVREVEQLDFDIVFGNEHGTASSRASNGQTIVLPAATAISLGSPATDPIALRVRVSGVLGGAVVGRAEVSRALGRDEHAVAHLQLGVFSDGGAADLADGGCMPGGFYCGGDRLEGDPNTLYRCTSSGPVIRGACKAGCEVRPGKDDQCKAFGGACVVPGRYCGGDKLPGDPQTLYRCDGTQTPPLLMSCVNGCQVRPAGQDDTCL